MALYLRVPVVKIDKIPVRVDGNHDAPRACVRLPRQKPQAEILEDHFFVPGSVQQLRKILNLCLMVRVVGLPRSRKPTGKGFPTLSHVHDLEIRVSLVGGLSVDFKYDLLGVFN